MGRKGFHPAFFTLCVGAIFLLLAGRWDDPEMGGRKPPPLWKTLKYPPLPAFDIPHPRRIPLSNGMLLLLLEDHEFPTVDIEVRIRTGSIYEPADKVGLAGITATVMRTGGTKSISGDELDEDLESIAASLEVGIGQGSGFASLSVMKENLDEGLKYLSDVLRNPAFPEDKIALAKIQAKSSISRRNDSPSGIAFREFAKLIYGKNHPLARQTEYQTIDSITRDDLIAFHRRYFKPNAMIVGAWGDFDTDDLVKKIESAFAGWEPGEVNLPPILPIVAPSGPAVYHVEKEDVNQSNLRMGNLGFRMDDPDYFPLSVWYEILSGGFAGRLFANVRAKKGLAYSVGAGMGASYLYPGILAASAGTKSESTLEAISSILEEFQKMLNGEFNEEDIRYAKESLLNSFIFNFDTTGEIIQRQLTYEYYGYPADFLERYREGIIKATKAEMLSAARRKVHPESFIFLTVGKSTDFDKPLESLGYGPPTMLDISIPQD